MHDGGTELPGRTAGYRGRLAPSPTGYLHLGHGRTFWIAQKRARTQNGTLILRIEDLDRSRCKHSFLEAVFEDLRWLGLNWLEGPDVGGAFEPYVQSERLEIYRGALEKLQASGCVYPCKCSRQDVLRALRAPHAGEDEPIYPGTCRPSLGELSQCIPNSPKWNWRFKVPDGRTISFIDGYYGLQEFVAGRDFGDFVIWRHDDVPAYHLAVVVDDAAMAITEVVRGEDLLKSTARQLLLYEALGLVPPRFFHCPLVTDAAGVRLAKRHDALSLRTLRARGAKPEELREG